MKLFSFEFDFLPEEKEKGQWCYFERTFRFVTYAIGTNVSRTFLPCYADSPSIVPAGIGKHKSSKMAHFVFKCNKEDYLSERSCTAQNLFLKKTRAQIKTYLYLFCTSHIGLRYECLYVCVCVCIYIYIYIYKMRGGGSDLYRTCSARLT
jgi:hypothetical protein